MIVGYTGDEIGDNLSLIEKLKVVFNINLPELGEPECVNEDETPVCSN
jgi:hypothetical protein